MQEHTAHSGKKQAKERSTWGGGMIHGPLLQPSAVRERLGGGSLPEEAYKK